MIARWLAITFVFKGHFAPGCAVVGLTRSISGNYNDCDHNECRDQRKKPIKCFRAGLCGGRVERRHDKNFLVLTYFRSLSAGVRGTLRSLCYQPIASDFTGSAFTCASWISLHSVHRRVQCSNPERAEVICWTSMRDWHLGQRGHAATRGDTAGICRSGMDASRKIGRERYRTLCHR